MALNHEIIVTIDAIDGIILPVRTSSHDNQERINKNQYHKQQQQQQQTSCYQEYSRIISLQ